MNPKNIYNYDNYDSIKDNPEVDIIYIVLPNSMHAEYTVRGLQAGKHVLCEKPMAIHPDRVPADDRRRKKANRKLMVAYRCQYEPYNRELIRLARSQEFGPTKVILPTMAGFPLATLLMWRLKKAMAGGGYLMDIGIYALQASRYISGEEPEEINAITTALRAITF